MSERTGMTRRRRVAVIGTGGTFAMRARHRFDWVEYGDSGIVEPIDALLSTMGELLPEVGVVPVPFRALGSTAIGPDDWRELSRLIHETAQGDPSLDGFVVTHGTATLEETAWFLALTLRIAQPVVVTGAQRPSNTEGSDAVANLRAALAVAASPDSRGAGVVVVMDGSIFDARDVSKTSSFDLDAFESRPFGPLGLVDANAGVIWRRRAADGRAVLPDFQPSLRAPLPRVDIVTSYAGADGVQIDAAVAAGARGIVSAGLLPGRPAKGEAAALAAAVRRGVVVVQATRGSRGRVVPQRFLRDDGLLAAGDLSAQKARILLMLALTRTSDPGDLQRWFDLS
ncbi:asparaginase [Burkholderia sp. MR1-5-21]